ncbi:PTB domain-containing engulfment adapter protein 1 [Eumeta japonica]|uniref:PTB domain-containing engulfment adapter protein 1 n=1 Tax=Eumeta variegata TaxID=151549 RepID=A0A4C1TRE1_EUMVA|nr:PTB domain-containing engulfment adapter protein 1 [Eumeta japonica]
MASTTEADTQVSINDLPITFKVKYIGSEVARGLWGIKYTRRPVDLMVGVAKNLPPKDLPHCELKVSTEGVSIEILQPKASLNNWCYPIDTISYGVQDLVYTRVFAMIVVKDETSLHPFEVHAFVCDSRAMARKLTYALAAAFQDYSRKVKESGGAENNDKITPTRQSLL